MTRQWLFCALLFATGCAKCGVGVVDAGQPVKRSMELRAALMLVYPENRGATIREGRATLTRIASGSADWPSEVKAAIDRAHLTPEDAGLVGGTNGPFHVELHDVKDGKAQLEFWLPISDENIEKLYGAQVSISTSEMGLYFPRDPKLRTEAEQFDIELRYLAMNEARGAFLSRQALQLLERSSLWHFVGNPPWVDGGVPDEFVAELRNEEGDRYVLERRGLEVKLRFRVVTFAMR